MSPFSGLDSYVVSADQRNIPSFDLGEPSPDSKGLPDGDGV